MAERLVAEHDEVVFVGTPNGFEARLVPERGVPFLALEASGYDRARPLTLVTSSLRIALSTFRAWRRIGAKRPDVVIGFGGYVSIPVGFAAVLRRVPLVLHEQNSVPGLANRVLSRWARSVGVTYEESAERLAHPSRVRVTGNPVREEVFDASRAKGRNALGLPPDALVLLVFGGSRGARHLNTAVTALGKRLLAIEGLYVVLVAGRAEYETVRASLAGSAVEERFVVLEYVDDMGSAICAADLVVGRAGATSIAELTVLGAPCVLVPYPYATDDHQTKNARSMVDQGAAVLIRDDELDGQRFGDEVVRLLLDPRQRARMAAASLAMGRRDATAGVIRLAREAAGANHDPQGGEARD